jgi:hypothetical protein
MARHARPDTSVAAPPVLHRARAVALVVLATVVVGAALGLLLGDRDPTAAEALGTSTSAPPSVPRRDLALAADDRPAVRPSFAPQPTREASNAVPDGDVHWADVLGRLDATRSDAFGHDDVRLLTTVYVAGSRPLERDAAALADLAASGVRAVGLTLVVDQVAVVSDGPDEVVLHVVDRMPGYQLVRPDGSVAETRAARGPAAWLVTLRGGVAGWRIAAITSA